MSICVYVFFFNLNLSFLLNVQIHVHNELTKEVAHTHTRDFIIFESCIIEPVFTGLKKTFRPAGPDRFNFFWLTTTLFTSTPTHPPIYIHIHNGIKIKLILFQVFLSINQYSVHMLLGLLMQSLFQPVAQSVQVLMEFLSILTILFT